MKTIVCIVGTRPEGIKMAPVIRALRACDWARVIVVSTGQHREILRQTLADFDVAIDRDLDLMEPRQTLASLTGKIFRELDPLLEELKPDLVFAQGDTTTVMVASILCFYRGIYFGHVEAGLRTGNLQHPFPEEFNRVVTGRIATLHFAPTEISSQNLLSERIDPDQIFVTGNTVVDALKYMADHVTEADLPAKIEDGMPVVLVTAHRRENFGQPIVRICEAIKELSARYPRVKFVYPVHPNPQIHDVVHRELSATPGVTLLSPLSYREMVALMKVSTLILTDSGGIQEEAPALAKPVLVLRETTERPEAVQAGVVKIVGTQTADIVREVVRLLDDKSAYQEMARGVSPYGDGQTSGRIAEIARVYLHREASAPGR